MAKSAVKAMDAVTEFVQQNGGSKIQGFVIAGASKRGWTTWLTGAVDPRIKGIAPMVIDMLNMKAQVNWAEKVYGKQSEQIHDYTDLNLIGKMDDPPMKRLRSFVDPYSYRERYNMPKLILIGTNDRYWTVDSLRHYWRDLPGQKLIYQTPNAGHNLGGGKEATETLAAFFEMIADGKELPKMEWEFHSSKRAEVDLSITQPVKAVHLWTADSADRDFRDDKWTSRDVAAKGNGRTASVSVEAPASGYRAYLAEVVLTSPSGHDYKLSTEARVTPDSIKP
jgi:PhoPQ-activated pathogenicity-related protein